MDVGGFRFPALGADVIEKTGRDCLENKMLNRLEENNEI